MPQLTIEQALRIAADHHRASRLQDAESICRKILELQPDHPDALHLLGAIASQTGRDDLAIKLIRQATVAAPGMADFHCNLGILLQKRGQFTEAILCFQRALSIQPDYAEAHFNLGVVFANDAQADDAIACYQRALAIMPGYAEAHCNLGNEWQGKGQIDQAIACYQRAIELNPDLVIAFNNLGCLLASQGRFDRAVACFEQALAIDPAYAEAHFNLANAWQKLGRNDLAIACYQRALSLRPDYADAHNNLGNAWMAKGDCQQAVDCFQQALTLKPDHCEASNNLGNALRHEGQIDQAITCYQHAVSLNPIFAAAHGNLGSAWKDKGQIEKAIDCYQRALSLDPNSSDALNNLGGAFLANGDLARADRFFRDAVAASPGNVLAKWSLGMLLMLQGDYERGLPLYEWRRSVAGLGAGDRMPGLQWDGSEPAGRRILVHFEQGFGDAIQCVRYVPLIARRSGKVILAVPEELSRLMRCLAPVESLITLKDALPAYDLHCPIMSLPLAFQTTLSNIPADVPYLKSDPELNRQWRSRLPNDDRLKVGLAWVGRRRPDPHRAVAASELAPLANVGGVWFCSLQKPTAPGPPRLDLADFSAEIRDFADTAALIENLDLIITIDTSIAHLAGALGRPTWLLLKSVPDWRWLLDRSDSPWYPTMRLFRQPEPGDWTTPIRQIIQELNVRQ